jgi:outer membrane protein assembly factor BamB
MRWWRLFASMAGTGALLTGTLSMGVGAQGSSFVNWSQYLFSTTHTSYNRAATTITPTNAASLKQVWKFSPGTAPSGEGGFYSSPTVYNGVIYIGARNGYFYAINESTGTVIWQRFIGYVIQTTCSIGSGGFVSTATVKSDPTTGKPTVYVYGATGYLYAMNAANGADVWPPAVVAIPSTTVNDYYAWGSPLVFGGNIYVGISSNCDNPLVRGGVKEFSQAAGALENTYWSTPVGTVGASIWSSPATDGTHLFVTTGNDQNTSSDGFAVVELSSSLSKLAKWTVPRLWKTDSDFGGSPGVWSAKIGGVLTKMVGACNKDGVFYAFRVPKLSAGPVWTFQVGKPDAAGSGICIAAPIFDRSHLYLAGNGTTIGGTAHEGSVRKVDPATGQVVWQTGLSGRILGTPGMDGAGVIAAASFGSTIGQNGLFLIDASTGQVLKTISYASANTFAQPVFADNYLLVAPYGSLRAYAVG